MQHNPLISVIIPVFAAEKFIEETINSVVKQSYNNWELIVVNDGSPDNSESIILKLQENESRIQYYSKENTGVSDTRNFGISKARGALIAFLDADDAWLYNKLELQLKAFQDDPTVCWVFGDAWLADELMNYTEYRKGYDNDLLNNLLSWEKDIVPGPSSNIIVKSDCFRQGKISFDSSLSSGADQDITIQLAAKYKGICIPHPLWVYRVLPNSMSKNIKVMERDHLLIFNKAKKTRFI